MSSDSIPRSWSAFITAVMRTAFSLRASAASEAWVRAPNPSTASSGCDVTVPVPVTVTVLAAPGGPTGGGQGAIVAGQAMDGMAGRNRVCRPPAFGARAGPAGAAPWPAAAMSDPVVDACAVGRVGEARDGTTVARAIATAAAAVAIPIRVLMAAPSARVVGWTMTLGPYVPW